MNVNPFSYLIEKLKGKVDKSGDTMTGALNIVTGSGNARLELGNTTNSRGIIKMYSNNDKYSVLWTTGNLSADRNIYLPDKDGTVALTSDLGGVSHELKKSNASGVLAYQLSLKTIHVMEFSNATYHILVNDAYFYHADKKIGGDTLTLSYNNDTGIVTISGARENTNVHIAKWSIA